MHPVGADVVRCHIGFDGFNSESVVLILWLNSVEYRIDYCSGGYVLGLGRWIICQLSPTTVGDCLRVYFCQSVIYLYLASCDAGLALDGVFQSC